MPEQTRNPEGKGSGSHPHDANDYDNKAPNPSDLEFFNDPIVHERDPRPGGETHEKPGSGTRGNSRPDEEIKAEIGRLLAWQKSIDATAIQVGVENGVVTLSGNVSSPDEKRVAGNITGNVLGIRDVHNLLTIDRQEEGGSL